MARRFTRPEVQGQITVSKDGKTYRASGGVLGGLIAVWNSAPGENCAQVGGSQAGGEEALARILLRESIR